MLLIRHYIRRTIFIASRNMPTIVTRKNKIFLNYSTKRDVSRTKATDTFRTNEGVDTSKSMRRDSAYARPSTRSAKQQIVLRQARVRGGKWRLQKRQRALFLSAGTQRKKQKGKWRNSIRISTLVARRTPPRRAALGKTRPRQVEGAGKQGILRGEPLAHRIAIKYLYLYLHFKSAHQLAPVPASSSSRVIVGYARRAHSDFSSSIINPFRLLSPLPRPRGG